MNNCTLHILVAIEERHSLGNLTKRQFVYTDLFKNFLHSLEEVDGDWQWISFIERHHECKVNRTASALTFNTIDDKLAFVMRFG